MFISKFRFQNWLYGVYICFPSVNAIGRWPLIRQVRTYPEIVHASRQNPVFQIGVRGSRSGSATAAAGPMTFHFRVSAATPSPHAVAVCGGVLLPLGHVRKYFTLSHNASSLEAIPWRQIQKTRNVLEKSTIIICLLVCYIISLRHRVTE